MSFCSACVKDVGGVAALDGAGKIVVYCPVCEHVLPQEPKAGSDAPPPAARPREAVTHHASPAAEPQDVIGMIRARLTHLEAEIAKRAGMELEARKLRKMIAAADRTQAKAE
jgi:hypothetical protein